MNEMREGGRNGVREGGKEKGRCKEGQKPEDGSDTMYTNTKPGHRSSYLHNFVNLLCLSLHTISEKRNCMRYTIIVCSCYCESTIMKQSYKVCWLTTHT